MAQFLPHHATISVSILSNSLPSQFCASSFFLSCARCSCPGIANGQRWPFMEFQNFMESKNDKNCHHLNTARLTPSWRSTRCAFIAESSELSELYSESISSSTTEGTLWLASRPTNTFSCGKWVNPGLPYFCSQHGSKIGCNMFQPVHALELLDASQQNSNTVRSIDNLMVLVVQVISLQCKSTASIQDSRDVDFFGVVG